MTIVEIDMLPRKAAIDLSKAALLIIDMQRDFLEVRREKKSPEKESVDSVCRKDQRNGSVHDYVGLSTSFHIFYSLVEWLLDGFSL